MSDGWVPVGERYVDFLYTGFRFQVQRQSGHTLSSMSPSRCFDLPQKWRDIGFVRHLPHFLPHIFSMTVRSSIGFILRYPNQSTIDPTDATLLAYFPFSSFFASISETFCCLPQTISRKWQISSLTYSLDMDCLVVWRLQSRDGSCFFSMSFSSQAKAPV